MSNIKTIITFAVPAVTALLGLLWYFRRKQPAVRRYVDPPDKKKESSETEKSSDKSPVLNNLSKFDASNGQAGKGSSNTSENPSSSNSLDKESHDYQFNIRGDNTPVTAVSSDTKCTESTVSGCGDACTLQEFLVEDFIQEQVIKPSLAEVSSSAKKIQVDVENVNDESKVSDTSKTPQQVVEESIILPSNVKIVHGAPDSSSPNPEQANTADMSQKVMDKIDSDNLSVDNTSNVSNNCIVNDKKTDNSVLEDAGLNIKENVLISLNTEDQNMVENGSLTRSWHEDIPENMDDLEDNLSLDLSPENGHSVQKTNVDNTSSELNAADESSKSSDQVQESNNQNSVSGAKQKNQSNKLPSDQNSKTGLQIEKTTENSHSDSSSNCDNLSEASNDSGKGGSVQENAGTSPPNEERLFEFNIPSDMCGLFIGTRGKTIKMISQQSGARIRLQNNPYTHDFQICVIEGTQSSIDTACSIIKRKFPAIKYPGMDMTPAANPVIMPEIMQLSLPEGVSVDIVVSSIVDAGRIFVQQPTHPSYPSLDRLNTFMSQCYMQEGSVPDIPRPIEAGVICAAPMLNGWYRAQIMASHEAEGVDECDIKYVDYGGYSRVSSLILKQIRSDFMTLPFEAIECYLANITPLDNEQYFSAEAAVVLEELTQGKLLQGQVVGRAEDGIPYIHVYQITGANSALLVNREMVNRGVVRWVELME